MQSSTGRVALACRAALARRSVLNAVIKSTRQPGLHSLLDSALSTPAPPPALILPNSRHQQPAMKRPSLQLRTQSGLLLISSHPHTERERTKSSSMKARISPSGSRNKLAESLQPASTNASPYCSSTLCSLPRNSATLSSGIGEAVVAREREKGSVGKGERGSKGDCEAE